MKETPRTDAEEMGNKEQGWVCVAKSPSSFPPYDPWELSRTLEKEVNGLKGHLENCVCHLQGVSRRWPSEHKRHAECIEQANTILSKINRAK